MDEVAMNEANADGSQDEEVSFPECGLDILYTMPGIKKGRFSDGTYTGSFLCFDEQVLGCGNSFEGPVVSFSEEPGRNDDNDYRYKLPIRKTVKKHGGFDPSDSDVEVDVSHNISTSRDADIGVELGPDPDLNSEKTTFLVSGVNPPPSEAFNEIRKVIDFSAEIRIRIPEGGEEAISTNGVTIGIPSETKIKDIQTFLEIANAQWSNNSTVATTFPYRAGGGAFNIPWKEVGRIMAWNELATGDKWKDEHVTSELVIRSVAQGVGGFANSISREIVLENDLTDDYVQQGTIVGALRAEVGRRYCGGGVRGVTQSSAAWGDFDTDNRPDLAVIGTDEQGNPSTRVYRNNEDGPDDDGAPDLISTAEESVRDIRRGDVDWVDYDNDSDLDLMITGEDSDGRPVTILYRNEGVGSGSFEPAPVSSTREGTFPGVTEGSVDWGDYTGDGRPDLLITGTTADRTVITRVYRNEGDTDGDGRVDFQLGTQKEGVSNGTAHWGDFNADGRLDFVVTGATGSPEEPPVPRSAVYKQNFLQFTRASSSADNLPGVVDGSSRWIDADGNGDLELFLSGDGHAELYDYGEASSSFELEETFEGLSNTTATWLDGELDGDLDLFVTGQSDGETRVFDYRNEGDLSFKEVNSNSSEIAYTTIEPSDYDRDGIPEALFLGSESDGSPAEPEINEASLGEENSRPEAPASVDVTVEDVDGGTVGVSWGAGNDATTPTEALTYDVYVRETGSGDYLLAAPGTPSDRDPLVPSVSSRTLRTRGNVGPGTSATFRGLDLTTEAIYEVGVRTVDLSRQSSFYFTRKRFSPSQETSPTIASDVESVDASEDAGSGETVDFENTGVGVDFSSSTSGSGTARVEKKSGEPAGKAGIEEENISDYRYTAEANGDLEVGSGTEIRFAAETVTGAGVDEAEDVKVYKRSEEGRGQFTEQETTFDRKAEELVAEIEDFSEFVFASDSAPLDLLGSEVSASGGWNLVSVPIEPTNTGLGSFLPPGCESGFRWEPGQGSYKEIPLSETPSPGAALWTFCESGGTVQIEGSPAPASERTVEVSAGWNQVGPFEEAIAPSAVGQDPSGLIEGAWYRWDPGQGSYAQPSELEPGVGYWVFATEDGTLDFSGGGAKAAGDRSRRPGETGGGLSAGGDRRGRPRPEAVPRPRADREGAGPLAAATGRAGWRVCRPFRGGLSGRGGRERGRG
jgi:hypothetical protein